MPSISILPAIYKDVRRYGAMGDGATDDTSKIQDAIDAASDEGGGVVFFPPGTYRITEPLEISTASIALEGVSPGADTGSILQPGASFSGDQMIHIAANFCSVQSLALVGASSTYTDNPATDGICVEGAYYVTVRDIHALYLNGWVVKSVVNDTVRNDGLNLDNVSCFTCQSGLYFLGVEAQVIHGAVMSGIQNGDGILIEDSQDIELTNIESQTTAGSGIAFHVLGDCGSIHLTNFVGGGANQMGVGESVKIEVGDNGAPFKIQLMNSIFEAGLTGVTISNATEIDIIGCTLYQNATHGIVVEGGGTDTINIMGCTFHQDGFTAGAGHYEIQHTAGFSNTTITNCRFSSDIGSGSGEVTKCINVTGGMVLANGCVFLNGNAFAGNPTAARSNFGYNPQGPLTAPGVPASNTPLNNPFPVDCTVHVTGGTVTAIAIGGTATGLTSGSFRVPAAQTIKLTYTVAPSWTWFGD